ncbi:MAG: beta-propeller domain-containing protein, partial [Verrucomicrobiota bacterium]
NVSQPRLLSKVSLGENYSWSEAMWDEKAFNVLPAAGLILLPYQGDFSNGYASRVQLIDWRNDSLQLRGSIDHKLQPRRATLAQNRVISVSGWEFLAVNVDDRDRPVVTRDLTLAWPVDRVILSGDYLLEFGARGFFSGDERAIIRIGRAESPNQILTQWSLGDVPILGATVKSNLLYLLQSESSRFAFDATGNPLPQTNSATLSVIDLTKLPNLEIVGQTQATLSNSLSAWNLTPLWVRDDLLVWESANSYWFFPMLFAAQPSAHIGFASAATEVYATPASVALPATGSTPAGSLAPGGIVANRFMPPWFYGGGAGTELVAFNVSDSANPQFVSELNLSSEEWSTHNASFAGNGLVYLSHTKFDSGSRTDDDIWMEKYYLDVIDYSDAANPTLRDAVNISGALAGVSHEGNVLYTISSHTARSEKTWIDALAYDGVRASLIGALALPSEWPHPTLIAVTNIFVGVPKSDSTGAIEVWNISVSGKLVRASSTPLAQPAHSFAAFGQLFVAQTENRLQLFDATNPLALQPLVSGSAENCLWPNLEHADGSADRGLWAPLGDYGVLKISR